ncbi:MAG: response regulator [Spirochaetales bacterium]|nr:response regulator [Spirochaetales bacterium]
MDERTDDDTPAPTLLLVDDERIILLALKQELRARWSGSLEIETAGSGPEALEIFDELRASGGRVALILADYLMPVMKGSELIARMRALDGDLKAVILSGGTDDPALFDRFKNEGLIDAWLPKPWRIEELDALVRSLLGRDPPG